MGTTDDQPIGVSGCRLSDGRLHLGHFVGCFHPVKSQKVSTNFFIIQDRKCHTLGDRRVTNDELDLLLAQLYSISSTSNITPCLQSQLFQSYSPLYDFSRMSLTLRKLQTVHPKKGDIKDAVHLSVQDFTFPLDEATQFLALRASLILMNDDNMRCTNLARYIWKKIPGGVRMNIPEPIMLLEPVPRLYGSDGRKMAKDLGNCIFFMDDSNVVTEKVRSYARKLGWRLLREGGWSADPSRDPSVTELPIMTMLKAFDIAPGAPTTCRDIPAITEFLVSVIVPLMEGVRTRAFAFLQDRRALRERFRADHERAQKQIIQTIARLQG